MFLKLRSQSKWYIVCPSSGRKIHWNCTGCKWLCLKFLKVTENESSKIRPKTVSVYFEGKKICLNDLNSIPSKKFHANEYSHIIWNY